jgi:membrane associated rhomboid family serine protease
MGGRFDVAGYWLILMWLAFDLLGALTGAAGIAYWAHLGGFGAGFALAFALYAGGLIQVTVYDNGTLLDLLRPDEGTD